MLDITIKVVVSCDACGADLKATDSRWSTGDIALDVAPCATCVAASYEEGLTDGRDEAVDDKD